MSIEEALNFLKLVKTHTGTVRICLPHSVELMDRLRDAGYLPVVERTAWNEVEIVVSTPSCFSNCL